MSEGFSLETPIPHTQKHSATEYLQIQLTKALFLSQATSKITTKKSVTTTMPVTTRIKC